MQMIRHAAEEQSQGIRQVNQALGVEPDDDGECSVSGGEREVEFAVVTAGGGAVGGTPVSPGGRREREKRRMQSSRLASTGRKRGDSS